VATAVIAETSFPESGEHETHWESAVSELLGPMVVHVPTTSRRGQHVVRSREIGDLVLADWDCPPLEGTLTSIVDNRADCASVVILAATDGEERITFGGRELTLQKGALVVASGGRPGEGFFVPRGIRKRTLRLPRTALEAAGSGSSFPESIALGHDRPFVGLVHSFLGEVWAKLPGMNAMETEAARTALVTLLAAAIRAAGQSSAASGSSHLVLRAQLEQWIAHNLHRRAIRIEDLATAHHISTRTVHRTFALTGDTMTGVIRAQRIAGVRNDLVHTDMTIAAIAHRWRYYDPSHLGREFRRHYGLSPSAYRETYAANARDSSRAVGL